MLIGAALGAILVLSIAAATSENSHDGRFQLTATDNYMFKIDTSTGQVWKALTAAPGSDFMSANIK